MTDWTVQGFQVALAVLLVALNGFFVAAEFALVKVRAGRLDELVREGRALSRTTKWLHDRLDGSLSACQLGITMASLGLGWVGEPAFKHLIEPLMKGVGIKSEAVIHGVAFAVAFSMITALHLVVGEQGPKIFALRRPERVALVCAPLLRAFYVIFYPFLWMLNGATSLLLRRFGVTGAGHETPHSEDEIRALIHNAHAYGEVTASENRLIQGVFEFDDLVCRRVMVPRVDVVSFDLNRPMSEHIATARRTKHTRFPVADGSLENVLGVVHVKDFVGVKAIETLDLKEVMRPPRFVPETMPISRLLRHFQSTHQLLAFAVDEYGSVSGIVTLENVLEPIIGPVDDEFDTEQPAIVRDGANRYIVEGSTPVEIVCRGLDLNLGETEADTFSGELTARLDKILQVGDKIDLGSAVAEVLEVRRSRATRIRLTMKI